MLTDVPFFLQLKGERAQKPVKRPQGEEKDQWKVGKRFGGKGWRRFCPPRVSMLCNRHCSTTTVGSSRGRRPPRLRFSVCRTGPAKARVPSGTAAGRGTDSRRWRR